MFKIDDLSFRYRTGPEIFSSISLELKSGNLTILTGKNGSGKTTICRLLAGLIRDYQGKIYLENKDLKKIRTDRIAADVTYIKQETLANIVAATPKEDLTIWQHRFSTRKRDEIDDTAGPMQAYNLEEFADKPVWELSSGQLKRLNLASLLLNPDKYWIIDEPFAGLDREHQRIFSRILAERRNRGRGALVITHNPGNLDISPDQVLQIVDHNIKVFS